MSLVVANSWAATSSGSPTTLPVAVSGIAAGDLLVVLGYGFSNLTGQTFPGNGVSDNGSNTYTKRAESVQDATFRAWCMIAETVVVTPPTSVTLSRGATGTDMSVVVLHITGADTTSPFHVADKKTLTADDPTAPSITTTVADTILIEGLCHDGGNTSFDPPSLFTMAKELESNTVQCYASAYLVVSATGTYAPAWVTGASRDYAMVAAAYKAAAGGTAYSLDCQPASFTVSGAVASLVAGFAALAEVGSFAVTGADVTLAAGYVFNAEPGSFAVTGTDATLASGWSLSADPGTFAVTGTDASLLAARAINAATGSYTVSGFDATLTFGVPGTLNAEPGTFSVTGANATTAATRLFPADPGTYAVTGADATMVGEHSIAAAAASYTVTGDVASVIADRLLAADPGTLVVTGVNASIGTIFDMEIDAATGNVAVTGSVADLDFAPGLARLTTRGGRIRWNTTGRITQNKEGAVA